MRMNRVITVITEVIAMAADRERPGTGETPPNRRGSRRMESIAGAVRNGVRRLFGKLPLPEEGRVPIDFSAPSVPYYEDLARRFHLAQVILYLVLFVFVVTAVLSSKESITYANLYYLVKDISAASETAEDAADRLEYPSSDTTPAFVRYRGGLVVVGSREVTVLSSSGRQTMTAQVDYGTPAADASEKYFITYGLGENSFSVFNAFAKVHSETTDFPVYGAAVADDGSFVLLTRSEDYTSRVIFYDHSCSVRASYYLTGYALSVAVSPSGDFAAVTSVEDPDGHFRSKINIFGLSGSISNETVTVEDAMAGVCGFVAENRVAVFFSDRLMVLRTDGGIQAEERFGDELPAICTISSGRIAVLLKKSGKIGTYTVKVLDKNGNFVYDTDITPDAEPTETAFGGNVLYIRAGSFLYRFSGDGRSVTAARISRDMLAILPDSDSSLLVCGSAFAVRLYTSDFSEP